MVINVDPGSRRAYLEIGISAYKGDGEILDSSCLVCVVKLVARLHNMIEGQPSGWIGNSFIDRRRIQAYRLVVDYIPPALTITDKQLGIEAPRNHRIEDKIVP